MNKREKRKQEKQDKKTRNARLGYCHGCGAPWTKLTYEHVPPDRVQALIPEKYLRFNPFDVSLDQSKSTPKPKTHVQLPPCTIAHGGLKVKSFGECCQQLTQKYYGPAFFDWSRLLLEICAQLSGNEDRVQAVLPIEPLAVIKQIASIALAVSEFQRNKPITRLRDFIQNPQQSGAPSDFEFYAYLNPLRPTYKLPRCRLFRKMAVLKNIVTGAQAKVFAELSVPPLGYVILYRTDGVLDDSVQSLMRIDHFGNVPLNQMRKVALDIPVRTPFGPIPLRYAQDADLEPRKVESSTVT